jgi:hypothetical protein
LSAWVESGRAEARPWAQASSARASEQRSRWRVTRTSPSWWRRKSSASSPRSESLRFCSEAFGVGIESARRPRSARRGARAGRGRSRAGTRRSCPPRGGRGRFGHGEFLSFGDGQRRGGRAALDQGGRRCCGGGLSGSGGRVRHSGHAVPLAPARRPVQAIRGIGRGHDAGDPQGRRPKDRPAHCVLCKSSKLTVKEGRYAGREWRAGRRLGKA